MKFRRRTSEQGGPKVPAYIVTYSDMVTLLLTFFVMLLSLAHVQDPALFDVGRDSFLESIRGMGLGLLFSKREMSHLGNVKIRHFVSDPDPTFDRRSIDAKAEETRRILAKLGRSMTILRSQIIVKKTDFSVTNIHFEAGKATLNEPAKGFLTEFCSNLQQGPDSKPVKLYVLGLAHDAVVEKQQWILSARRAQVVAEFIQSALIGSGRWAVYSCGVGPGGDWVLQDSPISEQSHILIAVLRTSG